MEGLDAAAAAFDKAMGNAAPTRANQQSPNSETLEVEPIFGNSLQAENDIVAGGDDTLAPGEKPDKRKARREEPEDDEEELFNPDEDGEEEDDESGESDDGDQSEDDDEDESDDEDDEDSELFDRKVEVLVDGEPQEVTVREALNGYIRVQTWHQRMNKVNELSVAVKEYADETIATRKKYDALLEEAQQTLEAIMPAEPDWDKLFAEDPIAARTYQKQYEAFTRAVGDLKTKRAKAAQDAAEEERKEAVKFAQQEWPKFSTYAKWRTKTEADKDLTSMRRTALAVGFSEAEIDRVYDSRMLKVLHKASKYDRMMAARPKPIKNGKTPMKPGASSQTAGHSRKGLNGAQRQLAKTGRVEDAANVFSQIIRR